MKRPNLREALVFDEQGNCIGIKENKDISPEVRAAWDKMLGEDADRAWADYLARLKALGGVCPPRLRVEGEEFTKMVKEGAATEEEFVAWSIAKGSGLVPLLPSDVADKLRDRVDARDAKSVDRTTWPEGMTYMEWCNQIAQNCGASGRPVRDANTKRKKAAEKVVKAQLNAPRMNALAAFRTRHPDCTLPEAAEALFNAKKVSTVDAGKKWLGRMVRDEAIHPFAKGTLGRPRKS